MLIIMEECHIVVLGQYFVQKFISYIEKMHQTILYSISFDNAIEVKKSLNLLNNLEENYKSSLTLRIYLIIFSHKKQINLSSIGYDELGWSQMQSM